MTALADSASGALPPETSDASRAHQGNGAGPTGQARNRVAKRMRGLDIAPPATWEQFLF